MNPGTLDTPCEIRIPTQEVVGLGDVETTFSTVPDLWCSLRYLRGQELVDARQLVAEAEVKFVLRWSEDLDEVDAKSEIVVDGKIFDILEAFPVPGGRPDKLELLAKRRAD